jgi:hypothetical protein
MQMVPAMFRHQLVTTIRGQVPTPTKALKLIQLRYAPCDACLAMRQSQAGVQELEHVSLHSNAYKWFDTLALSELSDSTPINTCCL